MENDEIFLSLSLDITHLKSQNLQKLRSGLVEYPLNQIQNFNEVLNNCVHNHLKQTGGNFLEF